LKDKAEQIIAYLHRKCWLSGTLACSFLAAGEYNENYIVSADGRPYVFRINHGTQLGLENQCEYEFRVLEALASSKVTPLPYQYDMDSGGLGRGVLLMEYLSGKPLDYHKHLTAAARIFARIHSLPPSRELIWQQNPAVDIARESYGLLTRYPDTYYAAVRRRLVEYHKEIVAGSAEMVRRCKNEELCIVNTEVNSGNFIIGKEHSWLVDWEKAVVSYRYQDLAHFLVPTTTLWKTDYRFSEREKEHFLAMYLEASDSALSVDEAYEKTVMMERIILLRALSWCYMAYYEYVSAGRELAHDDTFAKITSYMEEAECFLE
jgi:thiamine kinase-like enzyme